MWKGIYQLRIFLTGEVPSRPENWHDFFNMLTWCAFPRAKAALNRRHFFAVDAQTRTPPWRESGLNRTAEQDLLTLFDEGGAIVITRRAELWDRVGERAWRELFWELREEVNSHMKVFAFGHALYESFLEGHPTLHASALGFVVDDAIFEQSDGALQAHADALLADVLARPDRVPSVKAFRPLPILGVPGYVDANALRGYYDNLIYFR